MTKYSERARLRRGLVLWNHVGPTTVLAHRKNIYSNQNDVSRRRSLSIAIAYAERFYGGDAGRLVQHDGLRYSLAGGHPLCLHRKYLK
jgi:hypothetical protein